ncbi:MAG TPA: acyl-CoA dehydrogenase family protein [Actinomycetota bacterium]|nr:acyl-CoA dehydrogenase family protein [Actinomycetota bacterium]
MHLDFGLTDEQREIVGLVRAFVADRVAPEAASLEERGQFPRDAFRQLGEMGLGGVPYSEKYGGGGQSYLTYLAVLEELATGHLSLAVGLSVHHLAASGVHDFGSEELKERYLPKLFSGEWLGAYALSEASSGSDAASLRTRAERDGDGWVLSGSKRFISHAGEAEYYLVMARTGGEGADGISAFVLEKGWEGFSFGKLEEKMGWRASPMRELVLDRCRVPAENLVGEEGQGFKIALAALDGGRLGIAAASVGLAQAALDAAVSFARARTQFGRPVIEFQGLQFMLADMATEVEAARRLYRESARARDEGRGDAVSCAMAKLFASDVAMRTTGNAVQVHGGYGYMREYPVERYMREAKALQIVEGTNQVQRMIIGRDLAGIDDRRSLRDSDELRSRSRQI